MSEDHQNHMLQIRLLGGFRVIAGEHVITSNDMRLRAAQQIIKRLALAPKYRLHREQVLATIWPEQEPRAAVNSFNQALYAARRALATAGTPVPFLTLRDQHLRLGEPGQMWVDAVAFEEAARRTRPQHDLAGALAVLDLYEGDLLPDDPYETWLDMRRAVLHQTYRALMLDLAKWAERPDDIERVCAALQHVLTNDPSDEEIHRALMRIAA